jgi:hypothetical protein
MTSLGWMRAHEEAQRAADQRAADLFSLGWENGAGAAIWARAVSDELAHHEEARAQFQSNPADQEAGKRVYSTALMLVVAIDQVLAFECRIRRITGDAELKRALDQFNAVDSHAEAVRDIAAHLDAYAIGEGLRQTGKKSPPVAERNVTPFIWWDGGATWLQFADEALNLGTVAQAAVALADVVERVRLKHLALTERTANAELRRSHGLSE